MAISSISELNNVAGSNTEIQYNNSGVFGASSNLTFDGTDLAVGNAAPSSYIDSVHGVIVGDTGDATSEIVLAASTTGVAEINFTDTADTTNQGQILYDHTNNLMTFSTAATEAMRFDSDGNAGINTTITNSSKLRIDQDLSGTDAFRVLATNASYASINLATFTTRTANSAFNFALWYANGGSDPVFKCTGVGNVTADGSFTGSGADYQEYFESQSGVAAEVGRAVVLDGDKIRYYNAATDSVDDIMGVTRPEADNKNSAVVGNIAWNYWTDKYLTDDYGVYEREDITVYQWTVGGVTHTVQQYSSLWHYSHGDVAEYVPVGSVTIPADAVQTTDNVRKLNPAYDPAQEENYQSREDRDEWWLIGLLGQIQIKAGEPTNPRWIKMKDISADVQLWYVR